MNECCISCNSKFTSHNFELISQFISRNSDILSEFQVRFFCYKIQVPKKDNSEMLIQNCKISTQNVRIKGRSVILKVTVFYVVAETHL